MRVHVLDKVGGTGVCGKVRTMTVAQFARCAKILGVVSVVVQCMRFRMSVLATQLKQGNFAYGIGAVRRGYV